MTKYLGSIFYVIQTHNTSQSFSIPWITEADVEE